MKKWPYETDYYSYSEVKQFCVEDDLWQQFRLSLKGLSTQNKLTELFNRRELFLEKDILPRKYEVQIDNYINALKRGGQLDIDCNIQR